MDALDINARLIRLYGRDTTYSQPNWRVVWSDTLVEKRDGTWEDYTPAGIYLGTKKGIREVRKYDYLAKPCWVLEKFHPVFTRGVFDEVREAYTYEPIYVFLDKNDMPLPLAWAPIELIVFTWTNAERKFYDHAEAQAKELEAEIERNRHILHQDDPKWKPTFKSSVSVNVKEDNNEHK